MYHPLGVIVPPMNETMVGANQAADFYWMGAQIGLADLKLDTKKVTRGANDCLLSLGMGSSTLSPDGAPYLTEFCKLGDDWLIRVDLLQVEADLNTTANGALGAWAAAARRLSLQNAPNYFQMVDDQDQNIMQLYEGQKFDAISAYYNPLSHMVNADGSGSTLEFIGQPNVAAWFKAFYDQGFTTGTITPMLVGVYTGDVVLHECGLRSSNGVTTFYYTQWEVVKDAPEGSPHPIRINIDTSGIQW